MSGGFFYSANPEGATFWDVAFGDAFLTKAIVKNATFVNTDLTKANLAGAELHGARADPETSWPPTFNLDKAGIEVVARIDIAKRLADIHNLLPREPGLWRSVSLSGSWRSDE